MGLRSSNPPPPLPTSGPALGTSVEVITCGNQVEQGTSHRNFDRVCVFQIGCGIRQSQHRRSVRLRRLVSGMVWHLCGPQDECWLAVGRKRHEAMIVHAADLQNDITSRERDFVA